MVSITDLGDKTVDKHIFSGKSNTFLMSLPFPSSPTTPDIPFPSLRTLDLRVISEDWIDSRLLQSWIQRRQTSPFRLISLELKTTYPRCKHVERQITSSLCSYTNLRLQPLKVTGSQVKSGLARQVLTAALCAGLEELELDSAEDFIDTLKTTIVESTIPTLASSDGVKNVPKMSNSLDDGPCLHSPLPVLSQQQEMSKIVPSWAKMLTRLSFKSPAIDSTMGTMDGENNLAFMRSIIKLLPRLEDLELVARIQDLTLFDRLGRSWPAVSSPSPLQTTSTLRENYCLTDRPVLKRLSIRMSGERWDDYAAWRERLQFQFRLLEELCIHRMKIRRRVVSSRR
ncbi:hypothetical protein BGZ83_004498 [Gryganskiella cystojenkinii]|nr:hypothetical protein BGZ83_004498 [Gryganskiella cystojenkinii]